MYRDASRHDTIHGGIDPVRPVCQGEFGGRGPGRSAGHTRTESHRGGLCIFAGGFFDAAKHRADEIGLPFDIELADIRTLHRPDCTCCSTELAFMAKRGKQGVAAIAPCASLETPPGLRGIARTSPYLKLPRRPRRRLLGVGNRMCWAGRNGHGEDRRSCPMGAVSGCRLSLVVTVGAVASCPGACA